MCLINLNKSNQTSKCPYCRYELPLEKWKTLADFNYERKEYLELLAENMKLKGGIEIHDKKESEFLRIIKILNDEMKEEKKKFHDVLKNNIVRKNKQKEEELNKLKEKKEEELNKLKEEKEAELNKFKEEKETELNKLKKENNDLSDQVKKLKDELNKIKALKYFK